MKITGITLLWSRLSSTLGELLSVISSHTLKLNIRNNVLFVKVDADSLRNELLFAKSLLMEKLNMRAGDEILKDIVIT